MKRKVVKHGPSSLIISLPSSWVKGNNVVKGSEVDVAEEGKRLVISTGNSLAAQHREVDEVDVDITGLDRTSLMFIIRSLYRLGYDTINVKFENDATTYYRTGEKLNVMSVIHKEVSRLIGVEVIQERENSCVIKDLEVASARDFAQVERRVFLLLMDAAAQLAEGAKKNNTALLETLEEKHDTITKFVSYCLRLLNKGGAYVSVGNAYHYHIIAVLDRVTDIIKYSARDMREYKKALSPEVMEILESVSRHLRLYYELFYNYEAKKVVDISISRYDVQEKARSIPEPVKTAEKVIAVNMASIADLILDLVEARTGLEYSRQ